MGANIGRLQATSGTAVMALLLLLPIFGCEDVCKKNPGAAGCLSDLPPRDGGLDAGDSTVCGTTVTSERLFVKSLELDNGEDVEVGYCGFYRRDLVFQMPDRAPQRGFIVQRVEKYLEGHTQDPDAFRENLESEPNAGYDGEEGESEIIWELFGPIERCQVSPYAVPCRGPYNEVNGVLQPSRTPDGDPIFSRDINFINQFPTAMGVVVYEFQASYYTEQEMGTYWPTGANGGYWGVADPRFSDPICGHVGGEGPPFWDDLPKNRLTRRIKVSWDCCPAEETVVEDDTHTR